MAVEYKRLCFMAGCGTVQITASDMGVALYTNYGFVQNENFMQYKIK